MKKHAKQTLDELKSQALSSDDLMRKLAQWDELGEMPKETQQEIAGGVANPNTGIGEIIDILLGIWFPTDPTSVDR